MSENIHKLGTYGEAVACKFLQKRGLIFITKNFKCRFGEIDLIMKDKGYFVFIEVRLRTFSGFGSSSETITLKKQKRLVRCAKSYLQTKYLKNVACRFDVIAINRDKKTISIEWIKDAFQVK